MLSTISRFLGLPAYLPPEEKRNFLHLYGDIFWAGVLNGSTGSFLGVFISRLGANAFQVGLLSAAPAVMVLLLSYPVSLFIRQRPTHQVMRISSLVTRLFYLLLIPLPFMLKPSTEIWVVIVLTLLLNIPGAVMALVTNAWLALSAPAEWRGQVMGTRNALNGFASVITVFGVGQILTHLSFELGYALVFLIGFIGQMMSTFHIFFTRPIEKPLPYPAPLTSPGRRTSALRSDVLRGPYGRLMLIMFFFQLAVLIIGPILPLYQVNDLKLSDQTISLGVGLFWLVQVIISTRNVSISRRLGYRGQFGIGTMLASLVILIFIYSNQPWIFMIDQFVSGVAWGLINGAQLNYLLEKVPPGDRQPYITWYSLAINAAILFCSLVGPEIAGWLGMVGALFLSVALRLIAGIIIYRRG